MSLLLVLAENGGERPGGMGDRKDGHALVELAAHEMGMGTATAQTQVAAERLGLEMNR